MYCGKIHVKPFERFHHIDMKRSRQKPRGTLSCSTYQGRKDI